jgi:thiamine-monophosphate kinase
MTELGPGHEFDLIRRMQDRWGSLAVGIGDDAAVIQPPSGEQLVVSIDTAVENVHFRRAWLSLREIAYRAVTAALSDLAAMAATPRGILVALTLPPPDARDSVTDLADGIGDAVQAADTVVVGGNLARGEPLTLTTTVIGSTAKPLTRKGAKHGDLLYVTGRLGGPRAALRVLEGGATLSKELRARFAHPESRVAAARWLAVRGATAAIDISDGLAADAAHLAAASEAELEIQVDRVPIFRGATENDALSGGEEYELLVAARGPIAESDFTTQFKSSLTLVGRVLDGPRGVRFTRRGERVAAPMGYDHFSV